MNKNIAVIILAAGKGERMKSDTAKVLHPLCGRPMLEYVFELAEDLKIKNPVMVLGHRHQEVRRSLPPGEKVVIQKRLAGTADAVRRAFSALKGFKGSVLVLYADIPLLRKDSIDKLLKYHIENNVDVTILAAQLDKPSGYGRILRDKYSSVCGIVEEKDADDFQKDIKEINTGIICFKSESLSEGLKYIRPNNRKKEYYLTDIISILYKKGRLIDSLKISDSSEVLGINSRSELAKANALMQRRINEDFMQKGITIVAPDSTFISYGVKIGRDTTIYPFTVIERGVKIGKRCSLGPFAHLREGTELKDDVTLGNFLEVVRSKISSKTLAKHFCYLGDSRIGQNVNIGAGTVTANFDRGKKSITVIKDKANIGSDTVFVAPVEIGKGAITGAGSVVTKHTKVKNGTAVAGVPARVLKKKG